MRTSACQNCGKDFVSDDEDLAFYKKLGVPSPTFCPACRLKRRLMFCNERSLYSRRCSKCGKPVVTMFKPETVFPVYCFSCFASDDWGAEEYARDYDSEKNFFLQFKELSDAVPKLILDQTGNNAEGCEFANFCYMSKKAYLSYCVVGSEDIYYSKYVLKDNTSCFDSLIIYENERGYELVRSTRNYNSTFLVQSERCVDSHFLYDCSNCVNCALSGNLRNKSYVFMNEQLTREEYQKRVAALGLSTYRGQQAALEKFREVYRSSIHRFAHIVNSVDSTGDFIQNSKNARNCFGVVKAEDAKNVFFGVSAMRESQDLVFTGRVENCYELALGGRGISRVALSYSCGNGSIDLTYCYQCNESTDCFGCIGLKGKSFCILNKQYSEEEYSRLVAEIKEKMTNDPYADAKGRTYPFGEYFPPAVSPFDYNETVAYEEFPLTKAEVLAEGYSWQEKETKSHGTTLEADALPDDINDAAETITSEVIQCPHNGDVRFQCSGAYRILPEELAFYKRMQLPLPRLCPNCRYYARRAFLSGFSLHHRRCMCVEMGHGHEGICPNEFETPYAPERPERIYCESCYQKEVI